MGGTERPFVELCEAEAGTKADMEDVDVDVVGGVDEVGVSGYDSEGFTLSEILSKKSHKRFLKKSGSPRRRRH